MKIWLRLLLLFCLAPGAWAEGEDWQYTLRPGDTLWNMCERFAQEPMACWRQLAGHNGIDDPRLIKTGDTLRVPLSWLKEKPIPAVLEAVRGEVRLYPAAGGGPRPVATGDNVAFGDTLETGDGSTRVRFADDSTITVKPSSLIVVTRYRRFLENVTEGTELRLERGSIRSKVTPRDVDEATFKVYTPGAAAAVRGTQYYVSVDSEATTRSEVIGGKVDVSAGGTTKGVEGGFATMARQDQAPIEPVPLLPAPEVEIRDQRGAVHAVWPDQQDAAGYWVELYEQPDGALVHSGEITATEWEQPVEAGDYRLLVRAIDENGLKGEEAWKNTSVQDKSNADLWAFLGIAALLFAL